MPANLPYAGGLLSQGQTPFNPGIPPGLLQFISRLGAPADGMARQIAANQTGAPVGGVAPMGQGGGSPVPPPSQAPPQQSQQLQAAPQPGGPALPPAPTSQGITGRPATDNALMAGGAAMGQMNAAGGTFLDSLNAGLASGNATFKATKDKEADRKALVAAQKAYAKNVQSLGLDPGTTQGLIGMGVTKGSELLAKKGIDLAQVAAKAKEDRATAAYQAQLDVAKADASPYTLTPGAVRGKGSTVIAKNEKPVETLFDRASPEWLQTFAEVNGHALKAGEDPTSEEAGRVNETLTRRKLNEMRASVQPVADPAALALNAQAIREASASAESARKFASALPGLEQAKQLLDSGQVITGLGANFRKLLAKARGAKSAEETETYTGLILAEMFPQLKPSLGGQFSEREGQQFFQAMGGDVTKQRAALQALLANQIRKANTALRENAMTVGTIASNNPQIGGYLTNLYLVDRPGGTDTAPAAPPPTAPPAPDFSTWLRQSTPGRP